MASTRITITLSPEVRAALTREAELSSPGAPNLSSTAVRLLARALRDGLVPESVPIRRGRRHVDDGYDDMRAENARVLEEARRFDRENGR